jgi:hypothetical protein
MQRSRGPPDDHKVIRGTDMQGFSQVLSCVGAVKLVAANLAQIGVWKHVDLHHLCGARRLLSGATSDYEAAKAKRRFVTSHIESAG